MVKVGTKKKRSKQQLEAVSSEEAELKQVRLQFSNVPIEQACFSPRNAETQANSSLCGERQ